MVSIAILLTVAAALVSQQCGIEANALGTPNSNNNIDNNLEPNVEAPMRLRRLSNYVKIYSKPEEEIRRGLGEPVELICKAMGHPLPVFRWEKNGQPIVDVAEINEILPSTSLGVGRVTSKLVLTSTVPGEDQYSCIATDGLHTASATTTVYSMPTEDSEDDLLSLEKLYLSAKPTITFYCNSVMQEMGGAVVLPCRVKSMTKSQVVWYDSDERLVRDSPRVKVLPSGDLVINDLRWSDMGSYSCNVKNLYGKDSISTFVYPVRVD